jgi:hypothetical protein
MGLTIGHLGKNIGYTFKVMKRAAEERRSSSEPIVTKVTKYYTESNVNGTSYTQENEGRPTSLVTSYAETAF